MINTINLSAEPGQAQRSSEMPTDVVVGHLNRHALSLTHPADALPHSCLVETSWQTLRSLRSV